MYKEHSMSIERETWWMKTRQTNPNRIEFVCCCSIQNGISVLLCVSCCCCCCCCFESSKHSGQQWARTADIIKANDARSSYYKVSTIKWWKKMENKTVFFSSFASLSSSWKRSSSEHGELVNIEWIIMCMVKQRQQILIGIVLRLGSWILNRTKWQVVQK